LHVVALPARARSTNTTAETSRQPILGRSAALDVNDDSSILYSTIVHTSVRGAHVALAFKLDERVPSRLPFFISHQFHRAHGAVVLELTL